MQSPHVRLWTNNKRVDAVILERFEREFARKRVRRQRRHHAGDRADLNRPEGVDCLSEIEHIVILMMENHSFDNYLGTLERGDGFAMQDGKPVDLHDNRRRNGQQVALRHLDSTVQRVEIPSQSWNASHIQWNGGALDGFPRSVEVVQPQRESEADYTMGYWTEVDLPFYHSLANTFPLATRWFSSCLGPTFPNRRFLIAGTAHGLIDDRMSSCYDVPPAGTIFDLLTAHGISWANYHNKPRGKTLAKSLFGQTGHSVGRRALPFLSSVLPIFQKFATGEFQFCADLFPRQLLGTYNHAPPLSKFFQAAATGSLPAVSLVDPDYGSFSEENPQDVQVGEGFAAEVIKSVMHGPGWSKTLLIWLYDEHGGYYDHVAPPPATAPDDVLGTNLPERFPWIRRIPFFRNELAQYDREDGDAGPRTFDRYGFRVPAVLVSPFAKRDYVTDTVFDHTSILKLIERKWNLPSLTMRDKAATAPLDALDFASPPAFLDPPNLASPTMPFRLSKLDKAI